MTQYLFSHTSTSVCVSPHIDHQCLPTGALALGLCLAVDAAAYGELTLTPWNFFRVNILYDMASAYGVHPWHWNFTQVVISAATIVIPMAANHHCGATNQIPSHVSTIYTFSSVFFICIQLSPCFHLCFRLPMLLVKGLSRDVGAAHAACPHGSDSLLALTTSNVRNATSFNFALFHQPCNLFLSTLFFFSDFLTIPFSFHPFAISVAVSLPLVVSVLVTLALGYGVGLSLVSRHQEIRFLLPVMPLLHVLVGWTLVKLWEDARVIGKAQKSRAHNKESEAKGENMVDGAHPISDGGHERTDRKQRTQTQHALVPSVCHE